MTLQNIKTELETIYNESLSKIEDSQKALEKLEADKEKINADIVKAEKDADSKAYTKAKSELWTVEQNLMMHKDRLEKAKNKSLVSDDEVKKYSQDITNFLDEYNLEKIKNLVSEIDDITSRYGEVLDTLQEAQSIYRLLSTKIFKSHEQHSSRRIGMSRNFEYKDWSIPRFITLINDMGYLKVWRERLEALEETEKESEI